MKVQIVLALLVLAVVCEHVPINKHKKVVRKQLRKKKDIELSDIYDDVPQDNSSDQYHQSQDQLEQQKEMEEQQQEQEIEQMQKKQMKKQYKQVIRDQQNKVLSQLNSHYNFPVHLESPFSQVGTKQSDNKQQFNQQELINELNQQARMDMKNEDSMLRKRLQVNKVVKVNKKHRK